MFKHENINEIIEEMPEYDLKIIQNNKYFKFGVDSIALAKFAASYKSKATIIDMCSGSGIVGLVYSRLIEEKCKAYPSIQKIEKMYFIEKQDYFASLNLRNLETNNFTDYKVLNLDIVDTKIFDTIPQNSIDIILINPPYHIDVNSVRSSTEPKSLAKFENKNFLENFFKTAYLLLKDKGEVYMVNKLERLVDIFFLARKYKIEPKVMCHILPKHSKKHALALLKFVKNGRFFLKIENPFIIDSN